MRFHPFLFCAVLLTCPCSVHMLAAASLPGSAVQKLLEVPRQIERFVKDGVISGAVTLVARHGEIVSEQAVGMADIASERPMQTNSLFWIASMTKPITAAGILALQDDGKLSIEDPVEKYLPEFRNQWIIEARTSDSMTVRRTPKAITIRHLLTHTSGIGDVSAPRPDSTLGELVAAYSQQPLQFAPGSKWSYSNAGINTLGRIIEVVSGSSYAEFLQARFFNPLAMKDTTFWPNSSQVTRLATSYEPDPSGSGLRPTAIYFITGPLPDRKRTAFPAGGLFSTASDYFHFCQLMLDKGKWKGRQLLSPEAVESMTRTQTGDLTTGFTDGMSYGLGFAVVKKPSGVTEMLTPGTFGHGGAYGTQAWTDRERSAVLILMIQRAKLPNADASDVRRVFQQSAISAIVE